MKFAQIYHHMQMCEWYKEDTLYYIIKALAVENIVLWKPIIGDCWGGSSSASHKAAKLYPPDGAHQKYRFLKIGAHIVINVRHDTLSF